MKKGEFCFSPEHFSHKYGNGSTLSTYEINYQRSSSHMLNKHKCYLDYKASSVPTSFTSNKFATITTSNYPYENDSSYKALLLDKIRNEYRKSSIVDKDINARTCRILMNASSNTTITNNNNNTCSGSNSNMKLHSITPILGNSPIKFQNLNNHTTPLTNTNNEATRNNSTTTTNNIIPLSNNYKINHTPKREREPHSHVQSLHSLSGVFTDLPQQQQQPSTTITKQGTNNTIPINNSSTVVIPDILNTFDNSTKANKDKTYHISKIPDLSPQTYLKDHPISPPPFTSPPLQSPHNKADKATNTVTYPSTPETTTTTTLNNKNIKYISSLDDIAHLSQDEQIKRLYHNNLFLYEEVLNLKKQNCYLREELQANKTGKQDENESDSFKNYLIEENNRLTTINNENEQIIDGLISFVNTCPNMNVTYSHLRENITNIPHYLQSTSSAPTEQNKSECTVITTHNNNQRQHKPICNKTITISGTFDNNCDNNEVVVVDSKCSKRAKSLKPQSKLHKKKKHIVSLHNNNNNDIRYQEYENPNEFWDYYNEADNTNGIDNEKNKTKIGRQKTCYACLFGLNNNTKGYSPLLCSPHRHKYIKQHVNKKHKLINNNK